MNTKFIEARETVAKAREALRRGDKDAARQLGEKAALLVPEMEDAWLVLAASDPNPEDALAYAQKALEVSPESMRARRGVEWAKEQLKQAQVKPEALPVAENQFSAPTPAVKPTIPTPTPQKAEASTKTKSNKRIWIYAGVLGLIICVVLGVAAWSAVQSPAFASILGAPVPTQENLWAQVDIAKPQVTPIDVSAFAPQVDEVTATPAPVDEPTMEPTEAPVLVEPTSAPEVVAAATPAPTEEVVTATPEIAETPGTMAMQIVEDTPTSAYVPPTAAPAVPPASVAKGNGERWIDVNLSTQSVYAYEGDTVVNSFIVSTGTWQTPTVTGQYKIYVKYRSADMSGPGYYLPDVPYVMYFYKGYGLHGTYWHHNFGTPMSHGCVNLETGDAGWLFNWASVGTLVNVHY